VNLQWASQAWEDYLYWQQMDRSVLAKINELVKECLRTPFEGRGKPELLRGNRRGYWSRRITQEHRLVYTVIGEVLHVVQCRYHYDD
jgi:toxin YoeB